MIIIVLYIFQTYVMCHYLVVKSLYEAREYNEALQVINESEICTNINQSGISFNDRPDILEDTPKNVSNVLILILIYLIYLILIIFIN